MRWSSTGRLPDECLSCLQSLRNRYSCELVSARIPSIQRGTIPPQGWVDLKRWEQCHCQSAIELLVIADRFQFFLVFAEPFGRRTTQGQRPFPCNPLGVRGVVWCELGRFVHVNWRSFDPALCNPVHHEKCRKVGQTTFEPLVPVDRNTVRIDHYATELLCKLICVL